MKCQIFDLRQINEFFNLANQDVDLIIKTFKNKFGDNTMYSTDEMLEIVSLTLKNVLDNFEEQFLESDIYFNETQDLIKLVSKRDRLDDLKWEYENIKDKRYKYPRYLKFLIKTLEQDETYELNSGECVDYPFNGVFISPDFQGYYFMKLEIRLERRVEFDRKDFEDIGEEE